jgi:glucose/arabinose dehydrogenase
LALTLLLAAGAGCANGEDTTASTPRGDASHEAVNRTARYTAEAWSAPLDNPTSLAFLPDGRALVALKGGFGGAGTGKVVVLDRDGKVSSIALELPVCSDAERGLVGIAVDTDVAANGFVYLYYTRAMADCHVGEIGQVPPADQRVYNRVSRFRLQGDTIDPSSETPLLDGIPGFQSAHNGGGMRFGPDGMLYVGAGESQLADHSPDPAEFGGKLLRIDPAHPGVAPPDNPFAGRGPEGSAAPFVWAKGFRNPYRFGIDARTGRVVVADVGDEKFEEVDVVEPGADYGWPEAEGPARPKGDRSRPPALWYRHVAKPEPACTSIIGGPVLRGATALEDDLDGAFAFSDFGCGNVWAARISGRSVTQLVLLARTGRNASDLQQGPDGALYLVSIAPGTGRIDRIATSV